MIPLLTYFCAFTFRLLPLLLLGSDASEVKIKIKINFNLKLLNLIKAFHQKNLI